MKPLEINVDLDGIVTDFDGAIKAAYEEQTGEFIDMRHRRGFGLCQLVTRPELIDNIVGTAGFFRNLPAMPGAIDTLALWHRAGHDVNILTSPGRDCLHSASEKFEWCQQHLPFLEFDNIIIAYRKHRVRGDVFIDDSPTQLARYKAENQRATLMTIAYPNNEDCLVKVRAQSCCQPEAAWRELHAAVLELSKEATSATYCSAAASSMELAGGINIADSGRPWCRDLPERMLQLIGLFPSLRGLLQPGQLFECGWDAEKLDQWACGPAPGSGAMSAARFVLGVWNPATSWDCGQFQLHRAWSCWDDAHRDVFLSWVTQPWWP